MFQRRGGGKEVTDGRIARDKADETARSEHDDAPARSERGAVEVKVKVKVEGKVEWSGNEQCGGGERTRRCSKTRRREIIHWNSRLQTTSGRGSILIG